MSQPSGCGLFSKQKSIKFFGLCIGTSIQSSPEIIFIAPFMISLELIGLSRKYDPVSGSKILFEKFSRLDKYGNS